MIKKKKISDRLNLVLDQNLQFSSINVKDEGAKKDKKANKVIETFSNISDIIEEKYTKIDHYENEISTTMKGCTDFVKGLDDDLTELATLYSKAVVTSDEKAKEEEQSRKQAEAEEKKQAKEAKRKEKKASKKNK